MSEAPAIYEAQTMDIVRNPKLVLAEAKEAAQQLVAVVRQAKLARKFGGDKEHLFFEAWQTLGKFYGCTPRVSSTEYVEFGSAHGFEAHASVIDRCGNEVSSAEAMCLNDEPNWKNKPLFQLKSMAQTRACSKALRNVFAWVAVLAGYEATPAEEMDGVGHGSRPAGNEPKSKSQKADDIPPPDNAPPTEEDKLSAKDKLAIELSDYCRMADGEVDANMFASVLKEISSFGDPPKYISDIDKASEKWCGSSLGKLREKVGQK